MSGWASIAEKKINTQSKYRLASVDCANFRGSALVVWEAVETGLLIGSLLFVLGPRLATASRRCVKIN